jgi:outer membrane protein W
MKKIISRVTATLVCGVAFSAFAGSPDMPMHPTIASGLYLGMGGSWNAANSHYDYTINNDDTVSITYTSALDSIDMQQNKFAPMAQVGYWAPIDNELLWGVSATYKYLNAKNNSNDVLINASEAFTGSDEGVVTTDLTLTHELLLIGYVGMQYGKGYFYIGAGPAMLTVTNNVNVDSGVNVGTASAPVYESSSFSECKTTWGGVGQLGYNYYFKSTWFLSGNYTYVVTADYTFNDSATLNGFNGSNGANSATPVTISREGSSTIQEFMFSINKVFTM